MSRINGNNSLLLTFRIQELRYAQTLLGHIEGVVEIGQRGTCP